MTVALGFKKTYCLRDVVDYNCTIGISVVHWSQRLVALLPSGIPYFELYGRGLIESDGLGKECCADG